MTYSSCKVRYSVRNLWWEKWHSKNVFSEYSTFAMPVIIIPMLQTRLSLPLMCDWSYKQENYGNHNPYAKFHLAKLKLKELKSNIRNLLFHATLNIWYRAYIFANKRDFQICWTWIFNFANLFVKIHCQSCCSLESINTTLH